MDFEKEIPIQMITTFIFHLSTFNYLIFFPPRAKKWSCVDGTRWT